MSSTHIQIDLFNCADNLLHSSTPGSELTETISQIISLPASLIFNEVAHIRGRCASYFFEVNDIEDEVGFFNTIKKLATELVCVDIYYDQVGEQTVRCFHNNKRIAKSKVNDIVLGADTEQAVMFAINSDNNALLKSAVRRIKQINRALLCSVANYRDADYFISLINKVDDLSSLDLTDEELDQIVSLACEIGSLKLLKHLLNIGLSHNYCDKQGNNLLMLAATCLTNIHQFLVEAGVAINGKNSDGESALQRAFKFGYALEDAALRRVCNYYLSQDVDITTTDSSGASLLWYVNQRPKLRVFLQKHGVPFTRPHDAYTKSPGENLALALEKGDEEAVIQFLNKDSLTLVHNPLYMAYQHGCSQLVKPILECGASPNETVPGNHSLFNWFLRENEFELAQLLVDFGLEPNSYKSERDHPISNIWSETKNHKQIPKLLKMGIDAEPILVALIEEYYLTDDNKIKILNWMREYNLDLDVSCPSDFGYQTALCAAIDQENERLVSFLLEQGANPNIMPTTPIGVTGATPLIRAVRKGNCSIVQRLIDHNVDMNYITDDSWSTSALHKATYSKNIAMTELLLKHGADPMQVSNAGENRMPLYEYALKHAELAKVYRESVEKAL